MNLDQYQPFWDKAEPLLRQKLEQIKTALQGRIGHYTMSEIEEGGDEELRLDLCIMDGDKCVMAVEAVLMDGDVNGGEGGVGVKIDLSGYGGVILGGYAPYNWTEEAYTNSEDEMVRRIEEIPAYELADTIVEKSLKDDDLLAALAID